MITTLQQVEQKLDEIQKQVQVTNAAYHTCLKYDLKEIEFYKKWLLRLLQRQCDLSAERYLLQLRYEPSTCDALDIIGADYIAHNGQIFITA